MSRFLLVCLIVVFLVVAVISPCYAGEGHMAPTRPRHRTLRNVKPKPDQVQPPATQTTSDPMNPSPVTQRSPISIHTLEGDVVPLPHEAFGPLFPGQEPINKEQTETRTERQHPSPLKWKGDRHH